MASSASAPTPGSSALPHITVLGSLNMDLVSYVSHHPEPGETMASNAFAISPGGKGANQAVACAKLSRSRSAGQDSKADNATATAHVSMVGAVGNDANGAALRANMSKQGVDVAGVQVLDHDGITSGVAIIVVDEPTGQNRIILSPGANYAFSWQEGVAGGGLIPPQTQLLILQLEIPLDLVLRALHEAKALGIPVLLNPAPAPATEEARAKLEAAFAASKDAKEKGIAHLVLNETETAALVPGLTVPDLDTTEGLFRAATYFLGLGVENIVMTLGGRGVYYATAATVAQGNGEVGELVPPETVKQVVDTTGAGDTFAGQYALEAVYASSQRKAFNCEAAVRKSNRASAITVQRKGAQDSIPWLDELE